ncbi:MAG: hypothetical protein ACLPY5_07475 [Candidatus Bathyarchaeia archaeon]
MKRKLFFSILLLAAIFFPFILVPNANSQSQASSTTTMTIKTPPSGQCSTLPLAFSAKIGQVIGGTFGADVTIDLYIISQNDYNAFTPNSCALPATANPLFSEQNVAGSHNSYSTIPIPSDGIYYYIFIYHNNGVAQLTSNYATINLTFPSFLTFISPQVSSNTIETTIAPTTTLQTSSSILTNSTSISTVVEANSTLNNSTGQTPPLMTSVTNLEYNPYAVIQPDGTASATVNVTVNYSGLPPGDFVIAQVVYLPSIVYVDGSATANPACSLIVKGSAWCAIGPNSTNAPTSGTMSTIFDLTFNSTEKEYSLEVQSMMEGSYKGPNGYPLNSGLPWVSGSYNTSQLFKITVTQTPPTPSTASGFTIPGTNLTLPYTTFLSALVPMGGAVATYYLRGRKRRTVSSYLSRIDSTYNEYAMDREDCKTRLEQLKHEIIQLLNKGKIDESHFEMLDEKIKDYLLDLVQETQNISKEVPKSSTAQPPIQKINRKYCAECGTQLSLENKTCHSCGSVQD